MESENNRPININSYNSSEGKVCASIKWLVTRIYQHNDVPDNLQTLFYRDDSGNLQLRGAVAKCLTSGTFYAQAASKILRNNVLVTQGISAVLRALSAVGVDVREADDSFVTEASLASENPLKLQSHLALIDSLMAAHLKSVISIERVVQAISAYTSVEKREEPLDCVDALLFWINKICLLVRDDVERNELPLESNNDATVPEMEDLYEDLCDGTCVCVLVSFYRPHDMPLQRIYFNDPMHINDCRFNLGLLKKFCEAAMPVNPFHFEIEDILYLHESLQPNVNAFLADLFDCFEGFGAGQPYNEPQAQPLVSPTSAHRRFVPIAGIPDLRAQPAAQSTGPAAGRFNRLAAQHGSSQRDRAISIASVDSLMTTRSGDSLMFSSAKPPPNLGLNVTRFGDLPFEHSSSNQDETGANGTGGSAVKASAVEAKLQMGELRRQYEANKLLQNAANEEKRSQASKDAFFRVMSKSTHDDAQQISESARDNFTSREDLSAQLHSLQEQINNIKLNPKLSATEHGRQTPGVDQSGSVLPYGSSPSSVAFTSSTNTLTRQPLNYMQEQSPYAQQQPPGGAQFGRATPTAIGYSVSSQPYGMYMDQQQPPQQQQFYGSGFNLSMRPASSQQNISYGGGTQTPLPTGFMTLQHNTPHSQPQSHYAAQPQLQPYFATNSGYQVPYQSLNQSPYYPCHPGQPQLMAGQYGSQSHPQHFMQHQPQPMIVSPPHHHQQLQMFGGPQPPMMSTGELSSPPYEYSGGGWHTADGSMVMSPPPAVPPHQPQSTPYEENNGGIFRLHHPNASTSRLDPPLELNRNLTNWGLTYRMGERAPRKSWSKNTLRNSETDVPTAGQPSDRNGRDGGSNDNPIVNAIHHTPTSGGMFGSASIRGAFSGTTHNGHGGSDETQFGQASTPTGRNSVTVFPTSVERRSAAVSSERRPVSAYVPTDNAASTDADNAELTDEMQAKRRALLLNQMRRKERIVAQSEEKEQEMSERRQQEQQKLEQNEQKKLERELKRQRLLEDYKRRKMEQDLGDPSLAGGGGGSASARMSASSTTSLNRGHSQPPIGRPKSQSNMSLSVSRTMHRSAWTHSNVDGGDENSTPRVSVPSTAEPTLKLYAKHQPKSNRTLMINALQYRVFPGAVTADQKNRVQCALAQSDSKHFLILFRDHKCQYRGMYTWDQISDTVYKIDGSGPKICREDAMVLMFKYDSGAKLFNQIPTKHLSATIDGFTIDEQFWQKTRIPHS